MSSKSIKYVLIILAVIILAVVIGVLIYEFIYKKHKSPIRPPSNNIVPVFPIQPPSNNIVPISPSPSLSPNYVLLATKLYVTDTTKNTITIQDYFNYVDWNNNSVYFMISGTNFYTKNDLNDSWVYASQIKYQTINNVKWSMVMENATTFKHTLNGVNHLASVAYIMGPGSDHNVYIVSLTKTN